jgi:hypothetical protein
MSIEIVFTIWIDRIFNEKYFWFCVLEQLILRDMLFQTVTQSSIRWLVYRNLHEKEKYYYEPLQFLNSIDSWYSFKNDVSSAQHKT